MTMKSFPQQNPALLAAYQNAIYEVRVPQFGLFQLHIGQQHPELDDVLRILYPWCQRWTFLTAWNPRSRPLPDSENARRQALLCARLHELGLTWLAAEGRAAPEQAPWQEESLFIMDLDQANLNRLGKEFEQNAVLVGEVGGKAGLLWIVDAV